MSRPLPSPERLERMILIVRGQKVVVDVDLARLYGVSNKALKQAVRRNRERFPEDFVLELTWEEAHVSVRSQSVTLEKGRHLEYRPFAFTEQGVAMLSSVLRSPRAIRVNIEIMRVFVRLRKLIATHAALARRIDALEKKMDGQLATVFDALGVLMRGDSPGRIGFR